MATRVRQKQMVRGTAGGRLAREVPMARELGLLRDALNQVDSSLYRAKEVFALVERLWAGASEPLESLEFQFNLDGETHSVCLDVGRYLFVLDEQAIPFSYEEFRLIVALSLNEVVAYEVLERYIWGSEWSEHVNLRQALQQLVSRTRRKLESYGLRDLIHSIPRVGYSWELHNLEVPAT